MSDAPSPVVRGLLDTSVVISLEALAADQLPLFTRNPEDFDHLRGVGLDLHAV